MNLLPVAFVILWTLAHARIPQNIQTSYLIETVRNDGLSEVDLRRLATAIIVRKEKLSFADAQKVTQGLDIHKIKSIVATPFQVEYYEIPLKFLMANGQFSSASFSDVSKNAQIISKNGETYVRWFVHPLQNAEAVRSQFQQYLGRTPIEALASSSRSMVVHDPSQKRTWSIKTSLSEALGRFKDKTLRPEEAQFQYQMAQIVETDQELKSKFISDNSYISYSTKEGFREAQIVREIEPAFQDGKKLISLSSFIETDFGRRIAKKNGFASTQEFIEKKIMPSLGETTAKLYGRHGLALNSFHSQNIVIQLDANEIYQDTKIRDLDFDVNTDIFAKVKGKEALTKLADKDNLFPHSKMLIGINLFNGINFGEGATPRLTPLLLEKNFNRIAQAYFKSFLMNLAQIRGIPFDEKSLDAEVSGLASSSQGKPVLGLFEADIDRIYSNKPLSAPKKDLRIAFTQQEIQRRILMALETGVQHIADIPEDQLRPVWDKFAEQFSKDPMNSPFGKFFSSHKNVTALADMADYYPGLQMDSVMRVLSHQYRHLFQDKDQTRILGIPVQDSLLRAHLINLVPDGLIHEMLNYNFIKNASEENLQKVLSRLDQKRLDQIVNFYETYSISDRLAPLLKVETQFRANLKCRARYGTLVEAISP